MDNWFSVTNEVPIIFIILFCAGPIVTPPLLLTVNAPVVVPFESAGKNCDALFSTPAALIKFSAAFDTPLKTVPVDDASIGVNPFLIVPVNPAIV